MRVVSLESSLKGHQPLYVFNFFIFDLEYLKQLQSSEPLHTKMHLILLLVGIAGCMGTYGTAIFSAEPCSKNAGDSTTVLGIAACM